ncbi:hypothetical protein GALL_199690 [mine drainage metagenome]|uniref:Uncharacterized protein n=1 Tax=mine drainage metagenome TaxID=410659 RepID=A0A1J5RP71_9ZZZZ
MATSEKRGMLAVLTVACGLVAGCAVGYRPSPGEIQAARRDSLEGTTIDSRRVNSAIFFVITTNRQIPWGAIGGRGGGGVAALEDAVKRGDPLRSSFGLAFAVDPKGYLITASHCLIEGSHTYLLGKIDGRGAVFEPRVVAKLERTEPGTECALLAIPRHLDDWLKPGALPEAGGTVVAVSWLVSPAGANFERGSVVHVVRYGGEPELSTIETTLPLWHGDSGAPLLKPDGSVVGVVVGGYRGVHLDGKVYAGGKWRGQGLACAPNWGEIEKLIREDEPARLRDEQSDHVLIDPPDNNAANLRLLRTATGIRSR